MKILQSIEVSRIHFFLWLSTFLVLLDRLDGWIEGLVSLRAVAVIHAGWLTNDASFL